MDLLQLRYFREIARDENITKTAERLIISQPALSKALSKLEKELGLPLFSREGRGIQLNQDGRQFFEAVDRALNVLDNTAQSLQNHSQQAHRAVSLANQIPELYTWFLEDFMAAQPDIPLKEVLLENTLGDALRNGLVDLALTFQPVRSTEFQNETLLQDELLLLVPPEHPLAQLGQVDISLFRTEPIITHNSGLGVPATVLQQISRPSYQVSDLMMVIRLVEQGYGVALLPAYLWLLLQPKLQFLRKNGRTPVGLPLTNNRGHAIILAYSDIRPVARNVLRCIDFCRYYFSREQTRLNTFKENNYRNWEVPTDHERSQLAMSQP